MNSNQLPDRSNGIERSNLIAACLIALGLVAFSIDMPFVTNFRPEYVPGEIRIALDKAEPFGHGYGVALIILTVWVMTRCRLQQLWPLAVCSFGAGITANLIKVFIPRIRPNALADHPHVETSFAGIMPWLSASWTTVFESTHHSFPSAHMATAAGLAIALATRFPQGKYWFFILAGLVGLHRVVHRVHFPSDVLFGAALGIVFATRVLSLRARARDPITSSI